MISAVPQNPDKVQTSTGRGVKSATPELILQSNTGQQSPEVLASLVFEDIGGQELISIVRSDMVNGQSPIYKPISNLSALALTYGPQTLIALQSPSNKYFDGFPIKLEKYLPVVGTGPAGSIVYIDEETRDLVINVVNIASNEQVEVQILKRGAVLNDTIY